MMVRITLLINMHSNLIELSTGLSLPGRGLRNSGVPRSYESGILLSRA
jgi:hypothetical protein